MPDQLNVIWVLQSVSNPTIPQMVLLYQNSFYTFSQFEFPRFVGFGIKGDDDYDY